ncbi:MAG: thioredoxin family protein [Chitinophagales bacterium]|nr:thioredoxin family protein [Bacteroidota bacterium]MCB9043806.1 thioredoxin family protein [Chitinophagales bacterium]
MRKNLILLVIIFITNVIALTAQEWQTDFDKAKELAASENKPIVLVFQGSDWCAPCIKLDREIWRTDTFQNYANEHLVMLKADFPRSKKNKLDEAQATANAKLAEMYDKSGIFPFVVILDAEGNVLGETGYKKMSPQEYIEHLESFL